MLKNTNSLSSITRKVKKLKKTPVKFVKDSKAYVGTAKTAYATWGRFGSFLLVLIMSLVVIIYYTIIASPRYVSNAQFVVEQAQTTSVNLSGLASLGATSPSSKDAYVIKAFIESSELAETLNETLQLKAHYASEQWDWFSRLKSNATTEQYNKFYQNHLNVEFDELSGIVSVEIQTFIPTYSQQVAQHILQASEHFINQLSTKMVDEQLNYAKSEVARAHKSLLIEQTKLVVFQDDNRLFNPEQQGTALLTAVSQLEASIIKLESELKALLSFMQPSAADVVSKQNEIHALKAQLNEEKLRLTSKNSDSLNKINTAFQEVKLNADFALQLYTSSLVALEAVRVDAYQNLKHVLLVQSPKLAEEEQYPRRIYSIITWFISLLLIYLLGRLIVAIIKEHSA
jgi:capsular polysaccharide transport system permease protein